MNITWNLQIERGASNPTWHSATIFQAMTRVTRYWAVSFRQVGSRPMMPIVLRKSGKWPMWCSGGVISVAGNYKWHNRDQSVLAMAHEIGHWLDGSRNRHASQTGTNVMQPSLGDPYINFSQIDSEWFKRLAWRSNLRPWAEPDYWRPVRAGGTIEPEDYCMVHMPCETQWWRGLMDVFSFKKQEWV